MVRASSRVPADTTSDAERGAQAIHRALNILEVFTTIQPSLSLTEISDAAGLTVPTAHRMVRALQLRGYIAYDALTGQYSLGSAVVKRSQVLLYRGEHDDLLAIAGPHLEQLRDLTDETVSLLVPLGLDRVCIAEYPSHQVVRMAMGVGRVFPVYSGAAGKALLSGLTPDQFDHLLERVEDLAFPGDSGPVTAAALRRNVMEANRRGYATSFGESVSGASAIAAPVHSSIGIIAAINIAGPNSRWTPDRMDEACPALLNVARILGEQLGWVPPD